MNREDAINQLKDQQDSTDTECAHCEADDIICELLESLGYKDVVEEYNKIDKWFA